MDFRNFKKQFGKIIYKYKNLHKPSWNSVRRSVSISKNVMVHSIVDTEN